MKGKTIHKHFHIHVNFGFITFLIIALIVGYAINSAITNISQRQDYDTYTNHLLDYTALCSINNGKVVFISTGYYKGILRCER